MWDWRGRVLTLQATWRSCPGVRDDRVRQQISFVGFNCASCSGSDGGRLKEDSQGRYVSGKNENDDRLCRWWSWIERNDSCSRPASVGCLFRPCPLSFYLLCRAKRLFIHSANKVVKETIMTTKGDILRGDLHKCTRRYRILDPKSDRDQRKERKTI